VAEAEAPLTFLYRTTADTAVVLMMTDACLPTGSLFSVG
jgi:hypothetical protein